MQENQPFYTHVVGDNMKAHIREEKKSIKLGKGTLFAKNNGEFNKVCDTAEYDETYTDDEIVKVALSEENMICATNFFNTQFVFAE